MSRTPPPAVLAEWAQLANPVDPRETQGGGIPAMEVALTILCFIVVGLRVYIRIFQTKSFGLDDALIIFNLVPLTGLAVVIYLAMTEYGWNRHAYDVTEEMMINTRKMGLLIQLFYLVSTAITKVSILLFYRRLTDRVSSRFRFMLYGTMFVVIGTTVGGFLTHMIGCRPLEAYWMQNNTIWLSTNTGKFKCYNEPVYIVTQATISMITDFIVCILPLSLFMKLQMHWRQKVALAAIFGVGFFLCFCGIMRMVKMIHTFYGSYDLTWSAMPVWIWTGLEAHMAVIIASLPALNHFFRKVLRDTSISDKFKSATQRFGGAGYGSGYNKTANSKLGDNNTNASDKAVIHVTNEIHLEERSKDSHHRNEHKTGHNVNINDLEMSRDRRAWLDVTSSDDDDSIKQHTAR